MRGIRKAALLIAASALVLSGCGGSDDEPEAKDGGSGASEDVCKTADGDGPKIGVAYDVGGRGDQSFNDSAYAGITTAVEDLDATCIEAEAGQEENDTVREERLRTLAEQGFNPIIAVGFIYSPAAAKVAEEMPDTNFVVVDGFASSIAELPNLSDLIFAEQEGSFLVGAAAAMKSEAKHVGFVGGTRGELIQKFEAGYVAGVKAVDPSIKVEVQYLTEDPNDGEAGFENPTGAKTAAEGQLDKGVDVIFHAAGKSGLGVFQAVTAAGEGMWAIGVDSDQYLSAESEQQAHILTSMVKRIDVAVSEYVAAFDEGSAPAGFTNYDLSVDGVGYATSGGFVDDVKADLDGYAEKIKSGEIKVPTAP
ncbi:BMP family lipoprotein [Nocardioides pantholopis]|uniref:BMP family lipoprotein n=1 Tax=Nocardioides pantholopis TaxID=2483798 RepID=UPI000FD78941|nr:BMP family ABC transporter substrate-binding protein [Nocardioides pantholopis]